MLTDSVDQPLQVQHVISDGHCVISITYINSHSVDFNTNIHTFQYFLEEHLQVQVELKRDKTNPCRTPIRISSYSSLLNLICSAVGYKYRFSIHSISFWSMSKIMKSFISYDVQLDRMWVTDISFMYSLNPLMNYF